MQEIKYPSVVPHLSHDGYHIIKEAIGSSGIKTIYNKSVAHYKFHEPKHSVHFDIGTAVHIAILEPEKFDKSVLKCGKSRTTSLYRELKKTKKENQIIITDKEYDICLRSRDSVHSKSECNKVIASDYGQSEMSAFAKDPLLIAARTVTFCVLDSRILVVAPQAPIAGVKLNCATSGSGLPSANTKTALT